ncbi:L,D-transpeptidase family protein [Lentisphaera marina]|uniref:L,D-transpeptidase family protein n=1 Tax=Lentisphaera marina TaxID=1111041 RepID=UPI002366877F|nr:L,D-transpeptidase family protein [Lentisphaera marina]MDD7986059.1 L,D-transpeptidase family protein [Lentisphaera marina]
MIALKQERRLELWAKTPNKAIHLINFPFTGSSGQLGPKLREGDGQIPEGIYKITSLNPNSAYHLSLKINYPNNFDQKSAKTDGRTNLGSNIFIHGNSLSIGCIPIGDENIEKLFFLVHKVGLANTKLIIAPNNIRIEKNPYKVEMKPWIKHKYQRLHNELKPFNNTPWQ